MRYGAASRKSDVRPHPAWARRRPRAPSPRPKRPPRPRPSRPRRRRPAPPDAMRLRGRSVALYGRFSPGARERLAGQITRAGGLVARDLTRRSDLLVIGSLAGALIDRGVLGARLKTARERGVPVLGERAFTAELAGEDALAATLPLATALAQSGLTQDDVAVLAAFDLIVVADGATRFGDAGVLRTAAELLAQGRTQADVVRILSQSRDQSPVGRHKIVLTPAGE